MGIHALSHYNGVIRDCERSECGPTILDGELVVVDHLGRSVFADLMQRRHLARYFAFDLISLNGEDLTKLTLLARKEN